MQFYTLNLFKFNNSDLVLCDIILMYYKHFEIFKYSEIYVNIIILKYLNILKYTLI